MNTRNPTVRPTEMVASPLEYHSPQRISNETFAKARELRRWLGAHPASTREEMPEALAGYLTFLHHKRLATWRRGADGKAHWSVVPQ